MPREMIIESPDYDYIARARLGQLEQIVKYMKDLFNLGDVGDLSYGEPLDENDGAKRLLVHLALWKASKLVIIEDGKVTTRL